ncbi:MAG: AMP-binding protein [Paludibacter sp.]|nr:AMP-binding protein [Paludibacter sp.]
MIKENLLKLFADSFKQNWDYAAFTDYPENTTLRYSQVATEIARLHILFELNGISEGDKIALIGKNSANWCIIYLATITYGAVIVPVLHEFNPSDIMYIIEHSDSTHAFADMAIWNKLENKKHNLLKSVFSINDFSLLYSQSQVLAYANCENIFAEKFPNGFQKSDIKYLQRDNSCLVSLNYTSGTTGYSKGVMLSGNALAGNITFGIETQILQPKYKLVAFLPFAHSYGCAFDFLTATVVGCNIFIITKIPTPQLLLEAFEFVHPNVVFSVPMIIEKIYQKKIFPTISKPIFKILFSIPLINSILKNKIRKSLTGAFGGNIFQVIIGGAAMNAEVEDFFLKIHFPMTIGYGMTECAPLISYTVFSEFVPTSCGKILPKMEVKIIDKNPETGNGEVCVRGENLMLGYYKNKQATDESIDNEGWFHTGDLGTVSEDGTIFLRGRSKTMILNSNGQNIYPEEIEAKLSLMPYVSECLIVKRGKKLVALIFPDYEELTERYIDKDMLNVLMEINRIELNTQVAKYEQIAYLEIRENEFEKTPKKSIKRFLYK